MEKSQNPQGPLHRLADGKLKATVWENEGKDGVYHTVTLAKTYEDRDGQLRDSHSFTGGELLRIAELARESHGVIRDIRREQSRERKEARDNSQEPRRDDVVSERDSRPKRFR